MGSETDFKGACGQTPARRTSVPSARSPRGDYMSLFGSGLKHTLAGRQLALAQARIHAYPSGPHFWRVTRAVLSP